MKGRAVMSQDWRLVRHNCRAAWLQLHGTKNRRHPQVRLSGRYKLLSKSESWVVTSGEEYGNDTPSQNIALAVETRLGLWRSFLPTINSSLPCLV